MMGVEDTATEKRSVVGSRRLSPVDLDKIQHQLSVVLKREVLRLLDESYVEKLSELSAKNLVTYLKLLKDLREAEAESFEGMTDEELEKLAKKEKKS